ncbi:hypothetical protein V4F39_06695 [Aquincola sp. MAHUQ-54]|uniref:Uncharacterized protein n=1 Tax=Aquincola agrisoli TaxID=3119538 RepID=A0AAW9QA48_9BURK
MAQQDPRRVAGPLRVQFAGLAPGEPMPVFALYETDVSGRPLRKLAVSKDGTLDVGESLPKLRYVGLGPDVEDPAALPRQSLTRYRVSSVLEPWTKNGILLGRDIWDRFRFHVTCVSGTAKKCRPWWWDLVAQPLFERAPLARLQLAQHALQPAALALNPQLFPWRCLPMCDGLVEVYQRECCCHRIHLPDLFDRFAEILAELPIPLPEPWPPGPDPAPLEQQFMAGRAAKSARKSRLARFDPTKLELASAPPRRLLDDYTALLAMPSAAEQAAYVQARPHLHPLLCHCSTRKVGETPLQPGGRFDFCFIDWPHPHPHRHLSCTTVYAYKVKQFINGAWVVVYDGLAAHDYFGTGESAELHSHDKRAIVCDEPDDQGDGTAYAMLDTVGATEHFNFADQTGESQHAALDADDGTVVFGGVPGCPWGTSLALHLLITPEMKEAAVGARYYRLKVAPVDASGMLAGPPEILDDKVTWERRIIGGSGPQIWEPVVLGPLPAPAPGGESNLFTIPYWELGVNEWRMGISQAHQVWDTTGMKSDGNAISPNGRHALILELFDAGGQRIKPSGAGGAGTAKPFVYKRWKNTPDNAADVVQPDLSHVFWVDNTPVVADIVDLRKGGVPNIDECQFMVDAPDTPFSIGFRAYHVNGVDHAGNGDANSFMRGYSIGWQRGLDGSTGTLGHAPIYPDNHHDVAETGAAESSGSMSFEQMLTGPDGMGGTFVRPKCTFSVTLYVDCKHTNGSSRLTWVYDRYETASFALEIAP